MSVSTLALACLLTSSLASSDQEDFKLPEFKLAIAKLPNAGRPVKSCTELIALTNRLIQLGPSATRNLFEDYLAEKPDPEKANKAYVSPAEAEWCQIHVLLSLVIEEFSGVYQYGRELEHLSYDDLKRLLEPGSLYLPSYRPIFTIAPVHYDEGLIFQRTFLYFPNDLTPSSLRGGLGSVDWKKFRKSPIKLKPERATDNEMRRFLTKRFKDESSFEHLLIEMRKQNPPPPDIEGFVMQRGVDGSDEHRGTLGPRVSSLAKGNGG